MIGKKVDGLPADQLRLRHLCHQLDWSPQFDQALYFFGKKLLVKNFLVQTLFVTHKFKYPIYLEASFMKLFEIAYDYTCTASFLVRVLRHNMHHVDLSDLQAGLPGSCAYPYVPDCSARE